VRASIARIPPKDAIAAIIPAEVGERDKDFTGVGNDVWLEALLSRDRSGKEPGEFVLARAN
jgi:hypothetical protein